MQQKLKMFGRNIIMYSPLMINYRKDEIAKLQNSKHKHTTLYALEHTHTYEPEFICKSDLVLEYKQKNGKSTY